MSTVTTRLGLTKPAGIEQFSLSTYNNNLDLIDAWVIAQAEKYAKGRSLKTLVTADSGAVGSLAVINNIPTFTFKAGREYAVVWDFEYYGSTTNGFFEFSIQTCATTDSGSLTTGLTSLIRRINNVQQGGSSFKQSLRVEAPVTYGSDTTLQIKFLAELNANSGTVVVIGNAGTPALYLIGDEGDQI